MPGLLERLAAFRSPREEAEVTPGQELAYSEPLYTTGSQAYKYDPDALKSRKGHTIYKRMMVDEQVKAVVRFRRDAITGRDFFFQFDQDIEISDEEKEFRIRLFDNITDCMRGSFPDSLNAIMTGVWQGFSISEKVHAVIDFEGRPWMGLEAIKKKPHETFRFNVDRYGNVVRLEQEFDGQVRRVPIEKVIHYVQNPDADEHYGCSELREAHRSWFAKDIAIKFWNIYLERSAGGVWVSRLKDNATLSNTEKTELQSVLGSLSSASSVMVPAKIEIEHIQPQSNTQFKDAIEFHDLSIAKALLVPNLLGLSHTGQTGAFAQSQTQFKTFMLVLEADTTRLEAALNEQLFRELGELNFADKVYPRFKFKPLSVEQIIEMLKVWNDLVGKDTVEPSDTDEAHIRKLLEMPDKGEPLPRRPSLNPMQPGQPNNEPEPETPEELDNQRDKIAWKLSFTKAEKRVRFMVIDRNSQDQVVKFVEKLDAAVAHIVSEMIVTISEQRLGTPNGSVEAIGKLKFMGPQKARISNTAKQALKSGWSLGQRHARDEINAAKNIAFSVHMERIEDIASEYFNSSAFTVAGNLTADIEAIIKNVLTNGIKFSRTTKQVIEDIYKTLVRKGMMMSATAAGNIDLTEAELLEALEGAGLTASRLETIIRTNFFDSLNESRYSYFTDPELGGFVQAMEYSAILDSRTTAICTQLDGRTYGVDDWQGSKQHYRPPNHFNCRSILIAVTENDTWKESRDPTLDPQDGFG
jgi:SPP1 gp7 family putative phage head morphogenesis protein